MARRKNSISNSISSSVGVVSILLIALSSAVSADCTECQAKRTQGVSIAVNLKQHEDLLQRNEAYLAKLQKDDISKSVKVRSNIAILQVRILAMKNDNATAEEYLSQNCKSCRM